MEHLKTLRIAVLQAGRAVEEAIERHGDYDDMCKALVFRAPEEADTFCVLDGEFPDSIDAYDVFVVTGSKFSVYDELPWIAPLEALIRDIVDSDKKLIGVCFGHQIIATALGGEVRKSPRGFGVGLMEYQLVADSDGETPISLYAWHQDQVVEAPEGAEIIARSDFCEIAGMRIGPRVITFQAHPEFTEAYMRVLAEARRGVVISEEQADASIASLAKAADKPTIQKMLEKFMSS